VCEPITESDSIIDDMSSPFFFLLYAPPLQRLLLIMPSSPEQSLNIPILYQPLMSPEESLNQVLARFPEFVVDAAVVRTHILPYLSAPANDVVAALDELDAPPPVMGAVLGLWARLRGTWRF
jgi:hypothetical protein